MLTLGVFLLTALLVLSTGFGIGYHGQFTSDAFSAFVKLLMLAAAVAQRGRCRSTTTSTRTCAASSSRC